MKKYRGDTPHKIRTRKLVWGQHERLLGVEFLRIPHAFLASQFGGDVDYLLGEGVAPDNIWAVENRLAAVRALTPAAAAKGFRLFSRDIQEVIYDYPLRSVYLDFCGHLEGKATRAAIGDTIENMTEGGVVSITLFRGREKDFPFDREGCLSQLIQDHTEYPVTLVQVVSYMSGDETSKGSPMSTWTFVLGEGNPDVKRVALGSPSVKPPPPKRRGPNKKPTPSKGTLAALKAWETRRRNKAAA